MAFSKPLGVVGSRGRSLEERAADVARLDTLVRLMPAPVLERAVRGYYAVGFDRGIRAAFADPLELARMTNTSPEVVKEMQRVLGETRDQSVELSPARIAEEMNTAAHTLVRYYATGYALARILDTCNPDWKKFFQTRMGAKFFEGTMPKIAEQLERLNDNLEALIVALTTRSEDRPAAANSAPKRSVD